MLSGALSQAGETFAALGPQERGPHGAYFARGRSGIELTRAVVGLPGSLAESRRAFSAGFLSARQAACLRRGGITSVARRWRLRTLAPEDASA